MIGDDFFYTLATLDLGYQKISYGSKNSSTCLNGLTIKAAMKKLDLIAAGSIVIVNLGSNDILDDKPLVEMMKDMVDFLLACNAKQIIPILTTLAPLPTCWLGYRAETLSNFNKFIKVNPFNYPVIDLYPSFVSFFGKLEHRNFQAEPRNSKVYGKKINMWNYFGRKRVLDKITECVGEAIVNIYSYFAQCKIQILKWHSEKQDVGLGYS